MTYIWKEWLEQSRSKGLWFGIAIIVVSTLFLIGEAKHYPVDLGFEAFLLFIFQVNLYFIPMFSLFLASFSIFQEKELKTALILLTKKESFTTFLFKKSLAVQLITIVTFVSCYFFLALAMKILLPFKIVSFLNFIVTTIIFLLIFNQIGLFIGTVCRTKMQLIGSNILASFFFIFLIDLAFLYFLPAITFSNLKLFSILYFLNPLNSLRHFLEVQLGLFSTSHMSRLMENFIFLESWQYVTINVIVWPLVFFGLAILLNSGVESDD